MKGTSVYVIGSSITINWAVAKELPTGLGYVPLQTQQLIQELTSRSPIQLAAEEGDKSVTEAEDMILNSLSLYALSAAFQLVCPKMVAGMVCMLGSQCGYPKAVADEVAAEEEAAKAKQDGKKSLYLHLGCCGDWPNIMPPGWDPATGKQQQPGQAMAL
ncbi:unnamed protein product [Sphagnum balticum]